MSDSGDRVSQWLAQARAARIKRDADLAEWRKVATILRALRAAGVSYTEITGYTGISRGSCHRLVGLPRRSSSTTDR